MHGRLAPLGLPVALSTLESVPDEPFCSWYLLYRLGGKVST